MPSTLISLKIFVRNPSVLGAKVLPKKLDARPACAKVADAPEPGFRSHFGGVGLWRRSTSA